MNLNDDKMKNVADGRFRSQSFISNVNNLISEEDSQVREELKIKDLMMKMGVLRNGIIQERYKNQDQEKEIIRLNNLVKEIENNLNKKEDMIVSLSKEKFELQSKLDVEKLKTNDNSSVNQFTNLFNGIFQKKEIGQTNVNETEFKKLQNDNRDLELENAILKKKVEDQSLDFEKCKLEYQYIINLQIEKMKKTENLISEKNNNIDELNKKLDIMFENYKKFDLEKFKFEAQINDITKDSSLKDEKIMEIILRLEDKEDEILTYKESLHRHQNENTELARKLAELKNVIIESNMSIQKFKCEKVGSIFNKDIEVTFGRTEDDEYVMTILEDNKLEYINVEDIEYLKSNDKFIDMIDICYLVKFILKIL